jgi:hypothetical protein
MIRSEQYADLSHRQLSVVSSEQGIVEASPSSFYREMKKMGIESGKKGNPRIQEKPEVKPEKPNEAWSWDLTYIRLGPFFVYLFAIKACLKVLFLHKFTSSIYPFTTRNRIFLSPTGTTHAQG